MAVLDRRPVPIRNPQRGDPIIAPCALARHRADAPREWDWSRNGVEPIEAVDTGAAARPFLPEQPERGIAVVARGAL